MVAQSFNMLATTQPFARRHVDDVLVGLERAGDALVPELPVGVVVVDEQAERGAVGGHRPLDHLAVPGGIAGSEHGPAPEMLLDVHALSRGLRWRRHRPFRCAPTKVRRRGAVLVADECAHDALGWNPVQRPG